MTYSASRWTLLNNHIKRIYLFFVKKFSKGLVIGIIFAGFGLSPAVFSPLQTLIINPGKKIMKSRQINVYCKNIKKFEISRFFSVIISKKYTSMEFFLFVSLKF